MKEVGFFGKKREVRNKDVGLKSDVCCYEYKYENQDKYIYFFTHKEGMDNLYDICLSQYIKQRPEKSIEKISKDKKVGELISYVDKILNDKKEYLVFFETNLGFPMEEILSIEPIFYNFIYFDGSGLSPFNHSFLGDIKCKYVMKSFYENDLKEYLTDNRYLLVITSFVEGYLSRKDEDQMQENIQACNFELKTKNIKIYLFFNVDSYGKYIEAIKKRFIKLNIDYKYQRLSQEEFYEKITVGELKQNISKLESENEIDHIFIQSNIGFDEKYRISTFDPYIQDQYIYFDKLMVSMIQDENTLASKIVDLYVKL